MYEFTFEGYFDAEITFFITVISSNYDNAHASVDDLIGDHEWVVTKVSVKPVRST